jgi:hypothetical protein
VHSARSKLDHEEPHGANGAEHARDRRQLLLRLGVNYSCREGQVGWSAHGDLGGIDFSDCLDWSLFKGNCRR